MVSRIGLVTGSTSGIGLGIARVLATKLEALIISGFATADQVTQIKSELTSAKGCQIEYVNADLSRPTEIAKMFNKIHEIFPEGLDVLVNNAGVQHVCPTENFPNDKWDDMIAVNLSAPFHAIKSALPKMKEKGYGRIINIASAHGLVASANKAPYCATKHGIVGMTKSVALETAESGITCNAICPGFAYTPLVKKQVEAYADQKKLSFEEAKKMFVADKHPHKDFVTPEEIGEMIAYLCTPAARMITGATLSIDGGWSAW
ncbi:D-beta-hydroxybutyrate dehydrogenase-like [Oscarella lobularis]|uniref:D-beta-hydroxybutyrate dehydrogenase-like n=1 Tax=Oscarella lobularis TaxID=121494 RepID=UPI003313C99F